MSDKKINLESIILEAYGCKDVHDFKKSFDISIQMVKEICIEACRQILELAAENADVTINSIEDLKLIVDKQSILNTINQIE